MNATTGPHAMYIGFSITNSSGAALNTLQATLSVGGISIAAGANSGETFGLAGGQAATQYVGTLAPGAKRTLFWYVGYPCTPGSSANFTVGVTNAVTNAAVGSGTVTYTTFKMLSAEAGGAPQGIVDVSGAVVGQLITRVSDYSVGNIGSNNEALFQPVGNPDFKADCLQLVSTKILSVATGMTGIAVGTTDSVYFTNVSSGGSNNIVKVQYQFIYTGICANVVKALPFAYAGSGTQIKYIISDGVAAGTYFNFPVSTFGFQTAKSASVSVLPTGGTVTYTVTVKNTSAYDAYLDKVKDVLPTGATFGSVTSISGTTGVVASTANSTILPSANTTGTITFQGTPLTSYFIPAGQTLTIKYTATLPSTPTGTYTNAATAYAGIASSNTASVSVQVGEPKLTVQKAAGTFVLGNAGGSFTFTVRNTGNLATSGTITLTDTLPSGLTYNSLDTQGSAGWACTPSNANVTVTCTYSGAALAVNATSLLRILVNVPTGITTNIVNTASVSGGGTTGTVTSNQVTVPTADLSLTKAASAALVAPGSDVTYTLTLTNKGPSAATNVTVEDVLPTGTQYVSASAASGTAVSCTASVTPVVCTWTVPSLTAPVAPATSTSVTLTITVKMTGSGSVTNFTQVKAAPDTFDPDSTPGNGTGNGEDDTASVTVQIGIADLTLVKTAPRFSAPSTPADPTATPAVAAVTRTITYTLTVTNSGTAATSGTVTVVDTLPSGLTATAIGGAVNNSGWSCTLSTLTCTRSDALAVGGSYPVITLTVNAPLTTALETTASLRTVTNSARVDGGGESNTANNTGTANTKMVYAKLTKKVRNFTATSAFGTASSGRPGQVLEYCIDFTNFGGATLSNFKVTDNVPGNTASLTAGYDDDEPSTATGFGVKLTLGTAAPTYFTSSADTDRGQLTTSGGTFISGVMEVILPSALAAGETGSVCFKARIN